MHLHASIRCGFLAAAGLMVSSAGVAGPAGPADLPVNEWVKMEEGGLGQRSGTALVYVPSIGRFLAAMGVQTRFDRTPTLPYSEMTFNFEKRRWENWLPRGGEAWGGLTGPVNAPTFGYGSGLRQGKDGILRPDLRGSRGIDVSHLAAYDTHRKRILYGVDMECDPVERTWRSLSTKGHPGTPNLLPFDLGDMKAGPVWSQMGYDPVNREFLLFGGAKTITETGSPGTWTFNPETAEWRRLNVGDSGRNVRRRECEQLERKAHAMVTACRNRYYRTERPENARKRLSVLLAEILDADAIDRLRLAVARRGDGPVDPGKAWIGRADRSLAEAHQSCRALLASVDEGMTAAAIAKAEKVENALRRGAIALSAEPPPRCYSPMVFDPVTRKIVLFGGWALDRALADTWIYDCATRTWEERRPAVSPSPRLAHGLVYLPKSKKIVLLGGWVPEPKVGCTVFYGRTLPPEAWTYDVAANTWTLIKRWEPGEAKRGEGVPFPSPGNSPQYFACDENDVVLTIAERRRAPATWACRLDPTVTDAEGTKERGVGHDSEFFAGEQALPAWWDTQAPPPDPAAVEAELKALPVNKWVRRSTGGLDRPTFAYSSITIDTDHDQLLVFAGGHGTYHGTDITRYSLATDRWHTDYPAQYPLTFGYFATGGHYAYGFRPWMGVHPYSGYAYVPTLRKLVFLTGMVTFTHIFDPDTGDHDRPWALIPPEGGAWQTKVRATSKGACAWTCGRRAPARLWRLDREAKAWVECPIKTGSARDLAKGGIDNAGMTYDTKRNRLVLVSKALEGDVLTYDLATGDLARHEPANKALVAPLGFWREFEYVPSADLVFEMMGLAWDPVKNEWLRLEIDTSEVARPSRRGRGKPLSAGNSQGLAYDPKRDLLWAVNGYQNKGAFVLKLDAAAALPASRRSSAPSRTAFLAEADTSTGTSP